MRRKAFDNKGITLVDLLIVIAIMAILIAFLALNLMRYNKRMNASADIQVADALRIAIMTAMENPQNADGEAEPTTIFKNALAGSSANAAIILNDSHLRPGCLGNDIAMTMGIDVADGRDYGGDAISTALLAADGGMLCSRPGGIVTILLYEWQDSVVVTFTNTDATGTGTYLDGTTADGNTRISAGGDAARGAGVTGGEP